MTVERLVVSVLVPLLTAAMSIMATVYAENRKRTTLESHLDIMKRCKNVDSTRIEPLYRELEGRIAREIYALVAKDSSWKNAVWAVCSAVVAITALVISGVMIGNLAIAGQSVANAITAPSPRQMLSNVAAVVALLICSAIGIAVSATNASRYLSYRSYLHYQKKRLSTTQEELDQMNKTVSDIAQAEKVLRDEVEVIVEAMEDTRRNLREMGNKQNDQLLLYPIKYMASLEAKEASLVNLQEDVSEAQQLLARSREVYEASKRDIDYLKRGSLNNASLMRDAGNLETRINELQSYRYKIRIVELSLERALRSVRGAIQQLHDAQDSGLFDDQVVIESDRGALVVTNRKYARKYDMLAMLNGNSPDQLVVFRSHDSDNMAIVAEPAGTNAKVIGIIYPSPESENLESVLGYEVPTLSVVHADKHEI